MLEIAALARLAGHMRDRESTARAREIGSLLRRLREKADIKAMAMAAKLGWSTAKLSRIETGCRGVAEIDVVRLAAYCGATHHQMNHLLGMCREAEVPGYWLTERLSSLVYHESTAAFSASYDALVVPGLLQTKDYATTLIGQREAKSLRAHTLVQARMARQEALRRRQFKFFVHEQALRLVVGGNKMMHEQLLKLVVMTEHPCVTIRVVPMSEGEKSVFGGDFLMFHYQNGAPLLHLSQGPLGLFLEDRGYVRRYRPLLADLDHVALDRGQSRELLAGMATEFERAAGTQAPADGLAR